MHCVRPNKCVECKTMIKHTQTDTQTTTGNKPKHTYMHVNERKYTLSFTYTHTHTHTKNVFITSLPGTKQWNFHCTRLIFIYWAITQREWNSCTCLSITLFPNKFTHLIKQQTDTSQPGRKLRSDISTHAYRVHFIQQCLCMSPTEKNCG